MSIFNRFTILCAIARHIQLLLQINYTRELTNLNPDALIVDQLSAGLPLLQYFVTSGPILFYCHFPDMLLAQGREKTIKRLYRVPFDWLEEFTMGFAQAIAVNSRFTKGVVAKTWPALAKSSPMKVVYPCVETGANEEPSTEAEKLFGGDRIILSINRFERKKDIALAIKAFAAIPDKKRQKVRLVIAGMS
jgi:alpha-1,3/alpha-1,6-mannosyltransferase